MTSLFLPLTLLAAPKEIQDLQGTWTTAAGTVLVIEDEEIWIGDGEQAAFDGQIALPKRGLLQIAIGGEVDNGISAEVASQARQERGQRKP